MIGYVFTFAHGSELGGRCQIIYAEDYSAAIDIMVKHYGDTWAFQYTLKYWEELEADSSRMFPMEVPLDEILYQEVV